MCKKLFYFSFILLLCIASTSMAELLAYYSLDEGSGDFAADGTGNGHDGTISATPTWVDGHAGSAVQFGVGGSGVINCGNWDTTAPNNALTTCLWIKMGTATGAPQYQGILCNRNGNGDQNWGLETGNTGGFYFGSAGAGGATAYGLGTLDTSGTTWQHLAVTCDGATVTAYINGVRSGGGAATFSANKTAMVRIGASEGASNVFQGVIDEVYIYNAVLSVEEITSIMNGDMAPGGSSAGLAKKPEPGNKKDEISIDVGELSWTPGEYIEAQNGTHNVFFGTDKDSVTNATVADNLGTTVFQDLADDNNSVALDRLEYAATYFWRVDEVNNPPSSGTNKGNTWSFKTELAGYPILPSSIINVTSYGDVYPDEPDRQDPNSTCTGAGLDANDMHGTNMKTMWLGMDEGAYLQYEFDKAYKLYDMLVWNYNEEAPNNEYFGAKDVKVEYSLDGKNWTEVNDVPEFAMATGTDECVANTTVMFGGVAAKFVKLTFLTGWGDLGLYGISEVRFSAEPTRAQIPVPENAATGIAVTSVLSWKAGRYSVDHNVYISTDVNAVKEGTADMVTRSDANYAPVLALAKTYYWRVDEVNNAEAYPVWDGPTWSFSTAQSIIIDNFEVGYGNTEVNFVWAIWKDGVEVPANGGSEIGKGIDPPGLSTVNRIGNGHSLTVTFDNTGANTYSQVTAQSVDLPIKTTDWSIGSPSTLTIWFRGDPNTIAGDSELYCTIGSKADTYKGSADVITRNMWRRWDIDLAGVNLSNISGITIGIRTKTGGTTKGTGLMYIDDIALTGLAPSTAAPDIIIEAENYTTISLPMEVNNVVAGASGGKYIEPVPGTTRATNAPPATGIATYNVSLSAGTYIIYGRVSIPNDNFADAFWVKVDGATAVTTQTIVNGWARWNTIPHNEAWTWVGIWQDTAAFGAGPIINWVVPADGTITINVAYRDLNGSVLPKLDALMIVKN
jgi:hypothetical protein